MTTIKRPTEKPDVTIEGRPYWKVIMPDHRHGIYSIGDLGDYYFSILDEMAWYDEPQELYEWYKTVLPSGLEAYF